ncbi:hypothetical protein [Rothia nasimurium]|uniref:hypothetical protein n=1 Tax=Rothia nasimurium TaxID=85336 RepID=UPI003BA1E549
MNAQLSPTRPALLGPGESKPSGDVPRVAQETAPADVHLKFSLGTSAQNPAWLVSCSGNTAESLHLPTGIYTLVPVAEGQGQVADRLCTLPTLPAVARVDAISQGPESDHIWLEPLEAGTLADYCAARGKIPLGQVVAIANQLTTGLQSLHSHQMAYQNLRAEDVAFTIGGDLKLLPPDQDLRSADEATMTKAYADDTAACAAILWQCLTGEKPVAQRLRTPLPLAAPGTTEAMAETLENAIDMRFQQPTLAQIASLFEFAANPEPLELHLSAHPSVHQLLPTLPPIEAAEPPRKFRRKPASAISQNFNRPAAQRGVVSRFFSPHRTRQKPFKPPALMIGGLLILLGGGAYWAVTLDEPQQLAHQQVVSEAESRSPHPTDDGVGEVAEQIPPADSSGATEAPSAAAVPQEADEMHQIIADLIDSRSQTLAANAPDRIPTYAVVGGGLAEADRKLLEDPAASQLATMKTSLHGIETLTADSATGSITADIIIASEGFDPPGDSADLAEQGIDIQDGSVFQKARVVLQEKEGSYLLLSAEAVSLSPETGH